MLLLLVFIVVSVADGDMTPVRIRCTWPPALLLLSCGARMSAVSYDAVRCVSWSLLLQIMFNLEKAHFILDEMVMNGYIVETNKISILKPIHLMEKSS